MPSTVEISDREVQALEGLRAHEPAWEALLSQGVIPAAHPCTPTPQQGAARQSHGLPRFMNALAEVPQAERGMRARSALVAYAMRLGGSQDLGVILPKRVHQGLASLATVVPLRCPASESPSFIAFESALQVQWLHLESLQTFALDLLERSPVLQGQPWPAQWPWALHVTDQAPDPGATDAATLVFWLSSDGTQASLMAPDSLSAATIASAMDAPLAALTLASLHTPHLPPAQLPWLTPDEREQLLALGRGVRQEVPPVCLHHLFEAQVQRTPDAPAVCFGQTRLSYQQLDVRAQQCAAQLQAQGIGVGDLVAIALQRSVDLVVGLLGILKAGAAYVPIDCQHPSERITRLLTRSQPRAILMHAASRDVLPEHGLPMIDIAAPVDGRAVIPAPASPSPEDLAYVIFTSGSTGEPKGVEIRHGSLVNHAIFMVKQYALRPGDRMLCSASIGFDVAAEQIYPALTCGAEVVVRPDDLLDSFRRFDQFVRDQALTALVLPTAFWHEWVRELERRQQTVPPSLRVVAVGTEKAFAEALQIWLSRGAQHMLFLQGYGPTETTITCSMYEHKGGVLDLSQPLPIGPPVANTDIYLLDPSGELVPLGLPGEVYVGGMGLARGYFGRPDLTQASFKANSVLPHARLYKTGDMARLAPDGQLIYIGRCDFQIKLRGFRIEPAEVEAVVRNHPGVQECLVMLREDAPGLRQLTAYVISQEALDLGAMQRHCQAHLPEPMRPAAYVVLPHFPLNANGKVDRNALPAPRSMPSAHAESELVSDPTEQAIAEAFAEVLGQRPSHRRQSFFDLGGDSLRAVRLLSCLHDLGMELSLQELFAESSVAGLADRLRCPELRSVTPIPEVIELKAGTGVPLFLVAGNPIYRALAQAFPGPNPIYALLLPVEEALLRRGEPLPSLASFSAQYLQALRAHTPHGPYVLGGLSFGGVVAYEMAQTLAAEGEQVPWLILFDSILPRARLRNPRAWAHKMLRRGWLGLRRALGLKLDARMSEDVQMEDRRQREIRRVLMAHDPLLCPYQGPTVLYRAQSTIAGRSRPGLGWRGLATQLLELEVAGDHLSMMDSHHVGPLAQDLAQRMRCDGQGQLPSTGSQGRQG